MKSERDGINPAAKPSGTGSVEYSAVGGWWLHLRRCVECGHIGYSDTSPSRHASKHDAATGHPIITSFEPGERWFYDYRTGESFAGPKLHAPHSHLLDQPVPGPAEAVPSNWKTLVTNRGGSLMSIYCHEAADSGCLHDGRDAGVTGHDADSQVWSRP
jgi:Zn-finger in ubiquitin-hydrolases and other protein